jgi:hypothetical protein
VVLYMISFDLNGYTAEEHTHLRQVIEDRMTLLGRWEHFLTTTYLLVCQYNLLQIEATLTQDLSKRDRMLICQTQTPIGGYLDESQREWITTNT